LVETYIHYQMKTQRKILSINKTQIAKINSFSIIGKGTNVNTTQSCTIEYSRTPKGGRTQTHSYELNCDATHI